MTQNTTTTQNSDGSSTNTTSGVLEQLVGPGKKFASMEDLAKGKLAADTFVSKLEGENNELRGIVQDLQSKQDQLAARLAILDRTNPNQSGNQSQQAANPNSSGNPASSGLSADDVVKLIAETKQQEDAHRNLKVADAALTKVLGSEAGKYFDTRSKELGMSAQDLLAVAAKSPQAFLSLLGINPNAPQGSPMSSGNAGTPPINNGGAEKVRNNTYYEAIKKQVGVRKFALDKSIQIQMHKDMQALGDAFYQ